MSFELNFSRTKISAMQSFSDMKTVQIYFKKIINAPIIERSFNFCSDFTYCCKNNRIQHAEICFCEDNSTFLATIDSDIRITKRDYSLIDNEGFWIGFTLTFHKDDIKMIRQYCETNEQDSVYDMSSFYWSCIPSLGFYFKQKNTHSCASLCFNALLQSAAFRSILLKEKYQPTEVVKMSHSADPNILYRLLKNLLVKPIYESFIQRIEMKYIYNYGALHNNLRKYIMSSSDYFLDTLYEATMDEVAII